MTTTTQTADAQPRTTYTGKTGTVYTAPAGRAFAADAKPQKFDGKMLRANGSVTHKANAYRIIAGDYMVLCQAEAPGYEDGSRVYPYWAMRLAPTAEQIADAEMTHRIAMTQMER